MPFAQQQPAQPQSDRGYGLIPYKNGQALTGYYMGCLGFVLPVLGPVAIVLGILGLMRAAREPQIKGQVHGIVAIVCGVLSSVLWLLLIFSWRGL